MIQNERTRLIPKKKNNNKQKDMERENCSDEDGSKESRHFKQKGLAWTKAET